MNKVELAYYELGSKSDRPIDIKKAWLRENRAHFCCLACADVYPKSGPLDPIVVDARGGHSQFHLPLEFVSKIRYEIIRDDLLAVLDPDACEYLNLGVLLDETGKQIPNYHTAQAKIAVLLRGGMESSNNGVCNRCGRRRYWPMPHGHGYLLRSTFQEGVPILRVQVGNFAVNQAIRDRIVAAGLARGMYFIKRPVLDEPEDGLPVDLKFYEKV